MSDPIAELLIAHKVNAVPVDQHRGPTTTLHTYRLVAGQKVSAFAALAKDMAVAVGQEEVRIHAPVKGTTLVGVEVPNEVRTFPTFAFDRVHDMPLLGLAPLSFPVGVDQNNNPVIASLTKMPHLLIAGQTGAGKSVALTTLITALIAQHSPAELELTLVDPKRVELGMFAAAPQVTHVVTDVDDVADRLDEVVYEMETRYEQYEDAEVRSIDEYNEVRPEIGHAHPYIVVVIDELADLMIQRKKDVEPKLIRIAQLGRAAGIHLVLATQRPTRDVITGLIKANVPSRWAFTVSSTTDSMVVLDQPGASALVGKGDSLWFPAGAAAPERVQAYLTPDAALQDVVQWATEAWPEADGAHPDFVIEDEVAEYMSADDAIIEHRSIDEGLSKKIGEPATIDAGLGGPLGPGLIVSSNTLRPDLKEISAAINLAQVEADIKLLASVTATPGDARRIDLSDIDPVTGEFAVPRATLQDELDYDAAIRAEWGSRAADRRRRDPEVDVAKWDPTVAYHKGEAFGEKIAPWIFGGASLGAVFFALTRIFG